MNIPITQGTGSASVATETVGGVNYQKIEVYGGGGASILGVNPDGSINASIIGIPQVEVIGSVATRASISGTVDIGNIVQSIFGASVIGTVPVVQSGTTITSISGTVALSPSIFGASIIGTVPVTGATVANQSVSGTIDASVIGTVPVTQSDTWRVSVAGTVPVTNVGSILAYGAPLASIIQGIADLRVVQGASVAAIASPGASIRNYINHVQISNFGSASVLVKISDNTTSTLGWSIAPAGGGSNYDCFYRGAVDSPITASINGTASVLVSMQGFTSAS